MHTPFSRSKLSVFSLSLHPLVAVGGSVFIGGHELVENDVAVEGKWYSVYIGNHVSLAQQRHVHGPDKVWGDTFVGMQSFVFRSERGDHVVVEPGATVIGATVAARRDIPVRAYDETRARRRVTSDYRKLYLPDTQRPVVRVNGELFDADQPAPIARKIERPQLRLDVRWYGWNRRRRQRQALRQAF